jgi:hypothetical protein
VALTTETVRRLVIWSEHYRPDWDSEPDRYLESGTVKWARSRRLGLLELERHKCYLGVQHVDPASPGWSTVSGPHARFFVSMFVDAECIALRTVPTMSDALGLLSVFLAHRGGTN